MGSSKKQLDTDPVRQSNVINFKTKCKRIMLRRARPVLQLLHIKKTDLPRNINWADWETVQDVILSEAYRRENRFKIIDFRANCKRIMLRRVRPVLKQHDIKEEDLPRDINWTDWREVEAVILKEAYDRNWANWEEVETQIKWEYEPWMVKRKKR